MFVKLDDEHIKCSICTNKFSCDKDNTHPEIRKHLPVLSSSQRCDHWFCHGCILNEQLRVAQENNGRLPKWLKCMICREKTSFNPAEPKYHRLLIDLLGRAQTFAAAQVKAEDLCRVVINTPLTEQNQQLQVKVNDEGKGTNSALNEKGDDEDAVKNEQKQAVKHPYLLTPSPLPSTGIRVKEEPKEGANLSSNLHPLIGGISEENETGQIGVNSLLNTSVMGTMDCGSQLDLGNISHVKIKRELDADDQEQEVKRPRLMVTETQNRCENYCSLDNEKMDEFLLCSKCKVSKPMVDFNERQRGLGESARCKICNNKKMLCSQCKVSKPVSSFTKTQKLKEELRRCKDCILVETEMTLLCSKCKVSKPIDAFKKKQRKLGESARCTVCIKQQLQMLLCSTCKVSKAATSFTKKERELGESARCHHCILVEQKKDVILICSICKVSKAFASFTKKQLKLGESAKCKVCIKQQPQTLLCSICKVFKAFASFTKKERELGESARCHYCILAEEKKVEILICSKCKVSKPIVAFKKTQRELGELAKCKVCNKQHMLCSHCKVSKAFASFTKKERELGESARCHDCIPAEEKEFLLCSNCKVSKPIEAFKENQRELGGSAKCMACNKQHMLCSHCKVSKPIVEFKKKERELGESARCKDCIPAEEKKILLCSNCNVSKGEECFSWTQQKRGVNAKCKECIMTKSRVDDEKVQDKGSVPICKPIRGGKQDQPIQREDIKPAEYQSMLRRLNKMSKELQA